MPGWTEHELISCNQLVWLVGLYCAFMILRALVWPLPFCCFVVDDPNMWLTGRGHWLQPALWRTPTSNPAWKKKPRIHGTTLLDWLCLSSSWPCSNMQTAPMKRRQRDHRMLLGTRWWSLTEKPGRFGLPANKAAIRTYVACVINRGVSTVGAAHLSLVRPDLVVTVSNTGLS